VLEKVLRRADDRRDRADHGWTRAAADPNHPAPSPTSSSCSPSSGSISPSAPAQDQRHSAPLRPPPRSEDLREPVVRNQSLKPFVPRDRLSWASRGGSRFVPSKGALCCPRRRRSSREQ
jgi:hypothetical protein